MTELAAPVQRNETPSGIVVEYCEDWKPVYKVDGVPVPRVTNITDLVGKDALVVWGMKVGMVGVLELADRGLLSEHWGTTLDDLRDKNHPLLQLMKENELTTWQQRDKAATRGTSVHQAFEDYFAHGIEPNPANYPPQEEGYVRAVIKFIEDFLPLEAIEVELMVGSKRHGYAGRLDLLAYCPIGGSLKTGPRTTRSIPQGLGIWDVKTSKGVYQSHKLQLAGYREAVEECGYGRADFEAVILLRDNGTYDVVLNDAKPYQFLSVLETYKALR